MPLIIRDEVKEDIASIRLVIERAFGQRDEADLVDSLRVAASPVISLVALIDSRIIGHIFFSPVSVESESGAIAAMGLAPMAVLPEHQGKGVGSALVREGLTECGRLGYTVVVVLGHTAYYPRFGFVRADSKGLRCEFKGAEESFMVVELEPDALRGIQGLVRYHPEFSKT